MNAVCSALPGPPLEPALALNITELQQIERRRDQELEQNPESAALKRRSRARVVRNCLQILPGEPVLVFAAGNGAWAQHLATVLRRRNPVTALAFGALDAARVAQLESAGVRVIFPDDTDSIRGAFSYIVGTSVLTAETCGGSLASLFRWLKPGGQMLLFENNDDAPAFLASSRRTGRRLPKADLLGQLHDQGFIDAHIQPYDIVPDSLEPSTIRATRSKLLVLEHIPVLQAFCKSRFVWAKKPGAAFDKQLPNLADHANLYGTVSIVVPCHNEEMNVRKLVQALLGLYGPYIKEILLVNDNSRDRTADVVREISQQEHRVRLVDRKPPNGVGRALRDGYLAATGTYILSMDCDFVQLLPALRDMFDQIAAGRDGAIGSRFSHESVLINYPSSKVVCNRLVHMMLKPLAPVTIRDVTNNLKLYRASIFKELEIEEPHLAANLETGLKPILAGYDIREVPISWINRTEEMGVSTFKLAKVGPPYLRVMWRAIRARLSNLFG